MLTLIKISWRSIWRNKRRTAITVSAMAFALALTVFFISFGEGVYAKMIQDAVRMQAGHFTLEHPDYREAPAIDLTVGKVSNLRTRLQRIQGVEGTKLLILGQGVAKSGSGAAGVALMAVEPSVEAITSPLAKKVVTGEYLDDRDQGKALIGKALAERLKLDVGKKMVMASNSADGDLVEELLRVKGVFETGAEEIDGYLIQVPLRFARHFYQLGAQQVTQLGVLLREPDRRDRIMAQARHMVRGERISVRTWEEVMPDLAAYIKIDGGSNLVFQGIIVCLSLFTIFNTILMSVLERTREFAVMMALGTAPWRIRAQVLVESAMIGLLGCAVGLTVGGLAGYWIEVRGFDLSSLYEEGVTVSGMAIDSRIYGRVTAELLGILGALVFVATMLTSLFAVRRISRISVAQVLR